MEIVEHVIKSVLPEKLVKRALEDLKLERVHVISVGKAAWRMARASKDFLKDKITSGIVITKYGHSEGGIEGFEVFEAGHPLPDENSIRATEKAIELAEKLSEGDTLLFLISGGGSSLFEKPLPGVTLEDVVKITEHLMKSGADIRELNTVRKHLSAVKGGRFAEIVHPAKVIALVLSDVLGDPLDMIASGPTYPDPTTSEQALEILERYGIEIEERVKKAIMMETPKNVENAEYLIIGNVEIACRAAAAKAIELGYNPLLVTTRLEGEAKEAAKFITAIAKDIWDGKHFISKPAALVFGGETVVTVRGNGRGGRNQELALAAALEIERMEGIVLVSVGTDGTDGPTDAAGGIVDWESAERMRKSGVDPKATLRENDSYRALESSGDLLKTGPTGTNVNDVIVALIKTP